MSGFMTLLNPKTNVDTLFTQKGAFGLNPLNWGGKLDPNRDPNTFVGDTAKIDREKALSEEKAANAQAIAEAQAMEAKSSAQAKASVDKKKRAIARSRSVYTSPLGVKTEATLAKKKLLGE